MKKRNILELNRLTPEEFKITKKIPLIVILDNVRSLHNIGSVFRTADAFLLEKIILCGISSTPPHPEIHKTALGAEFSVEWEYVENTLDALKLLKNDNYSIFAVEQAHNSLSLDKLILNTEHKYALVLGNEVRGVQQSVVDACDACVEIPQYGTKHSLNVSVASGIVIWTFFNQLTK